MDDNTVTYLKNERIKFIKLNEEPESDKPSSDLDQNNKSKSEGQSEPDKKILYI